MKLAELKALCKEREIEYGRSREKGCVKLLLKHMAKED